jgi:opacity protein-like surface antigen
MQRLRRPQLPADRRDSSFSQSQHASEATDDDTGLSPHHHPAKGFFMPRTKWFLILVTVCVAAASPLAAQDWSGAIGGAYLWQDVDGSEDSFRSQMNLEEGFLLEDLNMLYRGQGAVSEFRIDAWGFGDANPSEAARLGLEFGAGFSFYFDYDRRASFFNLAGSDLALRADDWDITRYRGALVIDAWRPLEISLSYRAVDREGTVRRTLFGLNEQYPIGVNLDETMNEWTVRLATRTLPVRLELEQSMATYTRQNRPFAVGDEAVGGDPDELGTISSNVVEEMDSVPTTRFIASYSSQNFEGVASLLWRSAELNVSGSDNQTYLIGGGDIGTWEMVDNALGAAEQDTFAGAASLGFKLGRRWTLRLSGDYRDGSSNSSIVTDRLSRISSPLGSDITFRTSFDDQGTFDFTDSRARLTLEYRGNNWSVWGGGISGSREVNWQFSEENDPYDVQRDGTGYLLGAAWNPSEKIDLTLEIDRGDFDQYIFRVQPETVDRATLKLRTRLGGGWRVDLHGRHVKSDNPDEIAGIETKATPYGIACSWTSSDGSSSLGVDLEQYSFKTDTGLMLPSGELDRSIYELDLATATLYGNTRSGIFGVSGSLTYLTDDGDSFPVDAWNGRLRLTLYGSSSLEYSALVQYWSYDEVQFDFDDFDVLRYGLAVNWRF